MPLVALITMSQWGPAYPRIARWLGSGLREIGTSADIVLLDGPKSHTADGSVHELRLGISRARWALPTLTRYLQDRRPSMTLATPGAIGTLAVCAGRLAGAMVVPWVSTIPRLDIEGLPIHIRLHRSASTIVYRRVSCVAAVSNGVRDALAADLAPFVANDHLVVVPNPIHADEIRRLAKPNAERSRRLRFCSVGRLVAAKGIDVLIEAFSIANLGSAWELLLVGDGPMRPTLERLVRQRRLEKHVHFLGAVENPYPTMASADVAVQASLWEGFGMAILEALCLGVPQIATSCPGGVSDTLGNGKYGVLVPPGDPDELARALNAVAESPALRQELAVRGLERVKDYAPARVAEIVTQLATVIR